MMMVSAGGGSQQGLSHSSPKASIRKSLDRLKSHEARCALLCNPSPCPFPTWLWELVLCSPGGEKQQLLAMSPPSHTRTDAQQDRGTAGWCGVEDGTLHFHPVPGRNESTPLQGRGARHHHYPGAEPLALGCPH